MGLFDILTGNKTTKNGLNLIYSKNGDLLYEYNKIAGKIEGLLKVYYSLTESSNGPNTYSKKVGLVKEEYFFLNGLPNGYYKKFDLNSKLIIEIESIKSEVINFSSSFYFKLDSRGINLDLSNFYEINGNVRIYNQIICQYEIVNNKINNLKEFYENGQLKFDKQKGLRYFENGQLEENSRSGEKYYENGQLRLNSKSGEEYYENGQLKMNPKSGEEYYKNGQLKFDLINGREYYENGSIKIKNDDGAKYFISENLNRENFKDNYSFDCFIKGDSIISNNMIYNYYKNVLIYNESGEVYNIEEIVGLYSQENYFQHISRIRKEWKDRGGHISITPKKHSGTKHSEPLLINNFCFIVTIEYYRADLEWHDSETTTHLNPYTGLFNNINYEKGINSGSINFHTKERESKIENKEKSIAIEFYERGLEKDSNNNYEGAIIDFTKAIEIDKEFIDAYRNRASVKCLLGDYEGAIEDYSKIIEINSEDIDAYEDRGRTKYSLKNYIGAIEDFDKIIKIDSETKIYSLRGKMKRYLLDYDEAMLDYDIAVTKFPNDFGCVFGRGELNYEMANYHSAIEDFNKCIELKPKLILSFQKLGECKLKIEDYKGAIDDFSFIIQNRQEAYKIDGPPSENASKILATYYHNRGVARSKIKEYNDAISDFKTAIKLYPNCVSDVENDLELAINQLGSL